MSRKQKIWFGAIALIIFNAAFIVEDFSADFRYWDLVYILLILVLLTALLAGCFRWNVSNKKNVDTETGSFSKNFWMFNKRQLICLVCLIGSVTIVAAIRHWQAKEHMHPLTDPFIIPTIIVASVVTVVLVRRFRDKEVGKPKDEQKQ